jgi:hypothetical protein
MGFLDRLFGSGKKKGKKQAAPRRSYPSRSIITEPDLKSLEDLKRFYPLPRGFSYRERKAGDFVVVRASDGAEFVFLAEEGILAWDVPTQRSDGSWGKKTTEVLRARSEGTDPAASGGQAAFPLGGNRIDDAEIRAVTDLKRHYPLPRGFEYRQTAEGVPVVVRLSDQESFYFLIEEGLMTFDEPYTKDDGRTGYRTTEVFRRG